MLISIYVYIFVAAKHQLQQQQQRNKREKMNDYHSTNAFHVCIVWPEFHCGRHIAICFHAFQNILIRLFLLQLVIVNSATSIRGNFEWPQIAPLDGVMTLEIYTYILPFHAMTNFIFIEQWNVV